MSVRSAAPPKSGLVYSLLITVGLIAGLVGLITMIYIPYQYVTREELRDPVPLDDGGHSQLFTWVA